MEAKDSMCGFGSGGGSVLNLIIFYFSSADCEMLK